VLRRIELIEPVQQFTTSNGSKHIEPAFKHGLLGSSPEAVADVWINKLRGPYKKSGGNIPRNAKFYFTELGWQEVGRKVVEACQRSRQDYRVVKVKEESVNVVWRNRHYGYEVAAQPRKRIGAP